MARCLLSQPIKRWTWLRLGGPAVGTGKATKRKSRYVTRCVSAQTENGLDERISAPAFLVQVYFLMAQRWQLKRAGLKPRQPARILPQPRQMPPALETEPKETDSGAALVVC